MYTKIACPFCEKLYESNKITIKYHTVLGTWVCHVTSQTCMEHVFEVNTWIECLYKAKLFIRDKFGIKL